MDWVGPDGLLVVESGGEVFGWVDRFSASSISQGMTILSSQYFRYPRGFP